MLRAAIGQIHRRFEVGEDRADEQDLLETPARCIACSLTPKVVQSEEGCVIDAFEVHVEH